MWSDDDHVYAFFIIFITTSNSNAKHILRYG